MEIKTNVKSRNGGDLEVVYRDADSYEEIKDIHIHHVHAYAFCGDKLLVVRDASKDSWTPPGGHVEPGESVQEAVTREIKEESNMKVLHQQIIGYRAIQEPHRMTYQVRSFCIVEPYGPFVADPDNDIVEIKLIDPKDAKSYIDWGIIGDHILERACEMYKNYKK